MIDQDRNLVNDVDPLYECKKCGFKDRKFNLNVQNREGHELCPMCIMDFLTMNVLIMEKVL